MNPPVDEWGALCRLVMDYVQRHRSGDPLPAPKPGTHASHFGPWFDAIGNDPYAWQRAAVWSHAGRVAS